jgi:hypothetical protein
MVSVRPKMMLAQVESPWYSSSPICKVCGQESWAKGAYLCKRCLNLLDRGDQRVKRRGCRIDRRARFYQMQEQWDSKGQHFICYYTHVPLSDDPNNPGFATWEHREPGDETTVVLVAHVINYMKGDLTEREFKQIIAELARFFANADTPFDHSAFPSRPWRPLWRRSKELSGGGGSQSGC